jgi:hypothetical protein
LVPSQPAFQLKEFPVKKIALSVVLASTFALAACGGGSTPANNVADAMNQANAIATENMNTANAMMAEGQNQMSNAAGQMSNAAGQMQDAANQATGAAHDVAANTTAGH